MSKEVITRAYVENLEGLILPKLEAVRDSGNASVIHRANEWLSTIPGWNRYSRANGDGTFYLVTWREYIRSAEIWLVELAGGTKKDYWDSVRNG